MADDKLARTGPASFSADPRFLLKQANLRSYKLFHPVRGVGIISCDVINLSFEIANCIIQPLDSHREALLCRSARRAANRRSTSS